MEVEGLVRRYLSPEPVVAVDHVSFSVAPGEVFGLLGPNGAGKTTTLRMLATLLRPDEGRASIAGHDVVTDPEGVRRALGYLSGSTGLYGRLTAREMLLYFARIQRLPDPRRRVDELMARFGIDAYADQRCERLSTGMKQKVSIARAALHDPPVLILDEPTAGLDVLVAQTFLEFVEQMRDAGRCVLFSTHIMSEAERLCDRVGVIHQGRLLAVGTVPELLERTGERYLEQAFVRLVRQAS
ncbi:MAG: ATP-binding cassette domain-containing protein [Alphaproteobacteria bacterium]|nr:ATP-binding cassette domain-containing protein [Alphaproteobacteria bacterium]